MQVAPSSGLPNTLYANAIWRRQALISGPCDQHFSDSHQNLLGFTPKACFLCRKIEDQSNSMRLCNISARPGDHAPFLETHGNSVRLGRSAKGTKNRTVTCI